MTSETKPAFQDQSTTPLGDKTTEAKPDASKAPEAYADFTVPEGFTLNKEALEAAVPVFKELGLTQDQAQKLVDIQTKREATLAKSNQTEYDGLRQAERTKVLGDNNLSAGGKVKPEVLQTIGRAIDSIGDPALAAAFRRDMDVTGFGDFHTVVKVLNKLGQMVTEGRPVIGGGPSPGGQTAPGSKPTSIANAMYPNLK